MERPKVIELVSSFFFCHTNKLCAFIFSVEHLCLHFYLVLSQKKNSPNRAKWFSYLVWWSCLQKNLIN